MIFLREFTWDDVFPIWKASEAQNPAWIKTATEIKGWPDWESWRMFTANQLQLPRRKWQLFEIDDPLKEIPAMLVGPFTSWQNRLPTANKHTFAELVAIPKQHDFFQANTTVAKLRKVFPPMTMLTALQKPNGQLVLIEGHHRAVAVALAAHDQMPIQFPGVVQIAVAPLMADEHPLLDQILTRGSIFQPTT